MMPVLAADAATKPACNGCMVVARPTEGLRSHVDMVKDFWSDIAPTGSGNNSTFVSKWRFDIKSLTISEGAETWMTKAVKIVLNTP